MKADHYQLLRDAVETSSLPVDQKTFPWILALLGDLLKERDALREREAGLLEQHHRDSAELRRVCAERDEARADERTAMGYLAGVRQVVGGEDFPDMVRRVERLWADARRYRWLRDAAATSTDSEPVVCDSTPNDRECLFGSGLDAAIDKVMEASNAG